MENSWVHVLSDVYDVFSKKAGWLADLHALDVFDEDDFRFLEGLADYRDSVSRDVEKMRFYRETVVPWLRRSGPGSRRESERAVEEARQYPLEKLTDLNERGYVRCLWHDDRRPSMLIKNGFGYCFSCGAWTDSIKWIMTERCLTFPEAIRFLASDPSATE